MSFDTITFWLFFAFAWTAWRLLPFGLAKSATLASSFLFYAWWNPWFLPLIVLSAGIDFHVGQKIHAAAEPRARRAWLLVSVCSNLSLLGFFKYAPLLVRTLAPLLASAGIEARTDWSGWVIPVGISFYTFQSLSYSIDIYRERLTPTSSLRDFMLFVAFFPQLVAGPIVRARDLLPQFARRRRLHPRVWQTGAYYVIVGLFLKVVVADTLAAPVEASFDMRSLARLDPTGAWLAVIYFGVQIFADFAGYSGIAIGLAYLMGLRFPENFRFPYIASSLSEFWTRWHITLSEWLRDYLYIPLGGNRKGPGRTYVNLMITMLLGGLWHGAAWTFVAWGALHGLGLCVERVLRGSRPIERTPAAPRGPLGWTARILRILVVFVFVQTTWVFFRATSFEMAWLLLERMYVAPFREPLGLERLGEARYLVILAPVLLMHFGQLAKEWYGLRSSAMRRAVLAALMLFALTVVRRAMTPEFIYFQF